MAPALEMGYSASSNSRSAMAGVAAPRIRNTQILAYHGVNPVVPDGITITCEQFRWQISCLAKRGLTGVTIREFCTEARSRGRWPKRSVALTFDDGYVDCWSFAAPILQQFGFTATVFVITDLLEAPDQTIAKHCHPAKKFLDWDQTLQLRELGWEIASHTCDHTRLPTLSRTEQRDQIFRSKQVIESRMGGPVVSFCYPAGKFDAATLELVSAAGYSQAVVTPWRQGLVRNGDWRTLERVGIYRNDGPVKSWFKFSPMFHWFRRVRHRVVASS